MGGRLPPATAGEHTRVSCGVPIPGRGSISVDEISSSQSRADAADGGSSGEFAASRGGIFVRWIRAGTIMRVLGPLPIAGLACSPGCSVPGLISNWCASGRALALWRKVLLDAKLLDAGLLVA